MSKDEDLRCVQKSKNIGSFGFQRSKMHQSEVAEQSDADDRLRSAVNVEFQNVLQKSKEYCLGNIFCLLLENKWCTECISDMDGSSREWRSVVDARLQSSSIENIKNIAMKLVMIILHIRICVKLDSLVSKRSFRTGCANR